MAGGHPYDNEELQELRIQQRRVLACVPEWVLGNWRIRLYPPTFPDELRAQVEWTLRRWIQRVEIDTHAEDIAKITSYTDAEMLRLASQSLSETPANELNEAIGPLMREKRTLKIPGDGPFHRDLVTNLALADVLADDGYRDPRLKVIVE